jgi:type I restriction enzyme, S subunit
MHGTPGYKQTELGLIPQEWDIRPLGDLGEALIGLTYKPSDVQEHGTLVLRSSNVQNDALAFDDNVFVDADIPERIMVRPGDVLVCARNGSRGLIGKAALLDERALGMTFGAFMAVYRSPVGQLVSYLFQSDVLKRQIHEHLGATINQITNKSLASFRIPLSPLEDERQAIAEALSDVDALLDGLDRLIAKKRDLKQAAMQQLLTGRTRLPGFHGEWEVKTLFDLAERRKELFDDGDWIESEHITSEGIRLIQTGNIGVGHFVEKETRKFIYQESFTSLRCKPVNTGDLLLCRLADPAGRSCVMPDIGEEQLVTAVDVTIFRPPANQVDRVFLANLFSTPEWFRAVADRSGGTTRKRISRGALGRIAVKLPPLPEQTAIAEILSDMDAELLALEARRDKTRDLKQAMMEELLTGKTRLVPGGDAHA